MAQVRARVLLTTPAFRAVDVEVPATASLADMHAALALSPAHTHIFVADAALDTTEPLLTEPQWAAAIGPAAAAGATLNLVVRDLPPVDTLLPPPSPAGLASPAAAALGAQGAPPPVPGPYAAAEGTRALLSPSMAAWPPEWHHVLCPESLGGSGGAVAPALLPSGKMVAVKTIPLELPFAPGAGDASLLGSLSWLLGCSAADGDNGAAAAECEARLSQCVERLTQIDHPHLLPYLRAHLSLPRAAFGSTGAAVAVVSAYAAGGSIQALVAEFGPLSPPVAALHTAAVVRALMHLDELGYAHDNLNSSTVLLDSDSAIVLAEYALHDLYAALHPLVAVSATSRVVACVPVWRAPERRPPATAAPSLASDVWSLACLVIEMITGNMVAVPPASLLPSLPPAVRSFVAPCLADDPGARPSLTDLAGHAFLA